MRLPPPGWTLRSVAERGQLGVMIRGKWQYNTFGAMKQNTLLKWLPGVQTGLVGWKSRLRVPSQASEQILKIIYNYYPVRPKHCQTYKDPHVFQLTFTFQLPPKRNDFRETWLTPFTLEKKSLGNRNTVPPLRAKRFDSHGNKLETCLFPFLFYNYRGLCFGEFTLLEPS